MTKDKFGNELKVGDSVGVKVSYQLLKLEGLTKAS